MKKDACSREISIVALLRSQTIAAIAKAPTRNWFSGILHVGITFNPHNFGVATECGSEKMYCPLDAVPTVLMRCIRLQSNGFSTMPSGSRKDFEHCVIASCSTSIYESTAVVTALVSKAV